MRFPFLKRHVDIEVSPNVADAACAVATWQGLGDEETDRLTSLTAALAQGLRWEAANGFELTEHVMATISAHAGLLGLALEPESYREVSSVIVHASTIELPGEHSVGPGLYSDEPLTASGVAHHLGPVILAWDAVLSDTTAPWRGRNVILHEFAHHLDMLDGWVDGTPVLPDDPTRGRWIDVCSDAYERLRATGQWGALDPYGATNPGEFFAVAVETFFTRAQQLRDSEPALYGVLADYLGQDPANRAGSTP